VLIPAFNKNRQAIRKQETYEDRIPGLPREIIRPGRKKRA